MLSFVGMKNRLTVAAIVAAVAVSVGVPGPAASEPLSNTLSTLLQNHKKIRSAEADVRAALENKAVAVGAWFPTLDVAASYGRERQLKGVDTADTLETPRTFDLSLTQLIWDFGSTNSAISTAEFSARQSMVNLEGIRQALLLEAITAHLQLVSAVEVVNYAQESVDNIKNLAELEDAKVQRGSGFSSDVLEAKAQLAGAQARRVTANGDLQRALNRYKAVFGSVPSDLEELDRIATPADLIPSSLDEVVEVSLKENPTLGSTRLAERMARETIVKTKADSYRPVINAVAQSNHSNDESGSVGAKHEDLVRVELSYSFNLGLTARNSIRAAEETRTSLVALLGDAQDTVEEQARNAWSNLLTARENAELLRNQANITGEFLDDARKERALGRRSLIEVLQRETDLINVSSSASKAEMQVVLESYTALSVMGRLTQDAVR